MRILGKYSFAGDEEYISKNHPELFAEIEEAIARVDASKCLTKKSKEKTMKGKMLYSPRALNKNIGEQLYPRGWKHIGKYSFMVYNVCAKMTIFKNLGHIDAGVEVVPIKSLQKQMSSGVSYFEQFVWDLETRGISDIDVPTLILGIGI